MNGRKRFIITDRLGLLVTARVLAASRQDRDGARGALVAASVAAPAMRHVFAESGFAGRLVDWARETLDTTIEIARKPSEQKGFAVQPRRWVVERTLAWLTAQRRLARDYERHQKYPKRSSAGPRSQAWPAASPEAYPTDGNPGAPSLGPNQPFSNTLLEAEVLPAGHGRLDKPVHDVRGRLGKESLVIVGFSSCSARHQ
ncbi:transposase [Micromonospora sp. NBC_00362]|uniref:transposase n=1 Tax=Micromonospora sp. NBC_00362 TaxID=2975975 RepID=UPI00338F49CA